MKKLIRKLEWKLFVKKWYIKTISQHPLSFPMIIKFKFEGERIYKELGFKRFKKWAIKTFEELIDDFVATLSDPKKAEKDYWDKCKEWEKEQEIKDEEKRQLYIEKAEKMAKKLI